MSEVYYSLTLTTGPPFTRVATLQSLPWINPSALQSVFLYYTSIDFTVYDQRREALQYLRSVVLPVPPFSTFAFDPLEPPIPLVQRRFSASGTFVSLSGEYTAILINISKALSIVDTDPEFDASRTLFYNALTALSENINLGTRYYDRFTFELEYQLLWAVFPPP